MRAWLVAVLVLWACSEKKAAPAKLRDMQALGNACDAQEEDRPEDHKTCDAACALGHSNSCFRVGKFEEACQGGSGLGCEASAHALPPAEKAARLKLARDYAGVHCEQDHRLSCLLLGHMARDGQGGSADRARRAMLSIGPVP
jgi:hypothetical protein